MYNSGILDYYLMWIINVEMYMDKLHFIVNPVAGGTSAIDKFGAVKGMLDDMRLPNARATAESLPGLPRSMGRST